MKPRLPGLPAISALMLCAILTVWLGIAGAVVSETAAVGVLKMFQGWQTLIGFGGTLIVGMIAWINVSRQMRLTLIIREQDRIEEELPGLRKTRDTLDAILAKIRTVEQPTTGVEYLKMLDVEAVFPTTDDRTRKSLSVLLAQLNKSFLLCEIAQRDWQIKAYPFSKEGIGDQFSEATETVDRIFQYRLLDARENLDTAWKEVEIEVRNLADFKAKLSDRIEWLETLLPRRRAEIGSYLAP